MNINTQRNAGNSSISYCRIFNLVSFFLSIYYPTILVKNMANSSRLEKYQKIVQFTQIHAPISDLLGMKFTHVEEGLARFELDVNTTHLNSLKTIQGGVLTTMADAAMGIAFGTLIPEEQGFSTIELKINFIRPVSLGHLIAEGKVIHQGWKTGMAECTITTMRKGIKKLVAKATSSLIIL